MLAAATSFFARTNISQSYNIGQPPSSSSRPTTPGLSSSSPSASGSASGSNGVLAATFTPTFPVGLWKVQSAYHKVTNKRVSVWSFDKRGTDIERLGAMAKERTLEVLKAEASALSRLRHPSILEMVEPLEETRSELTFATEPILSTLELSIPGYGRHASLVELDEVEIQKGILQLCKGLSFLHSSAQLIHSNICSESIIINVAGDWKISGLGLTIPLLTDGQPTRWEFPTFDGRVPSYIQRSFDYMAPEYALDEQLLTASDMYSLGCLVYAVHCKGTPPFKSHGSLGGLRENAGKPVPGLERLDRDLQSLLRSMITRHATSRPTPSTLPTHSFFSSLPISTLNFLDRSNFTAKTREEKISFMKGLTSVLDRFSEGLKTRKILPSLLEEMKDTHLLPYILPNVFLISNILTPSQFASLVLPSLRPLFAVKEPPQNMLTLLDNLHLLQSKTEKHVFREQVLPLVYNALESEHAVVQERALKIVPDLCETIDYAEVQGVLFPRVALVFSKTKILTVKVATLVTFLTMVKTLDTSSLTQKLVPLLSKIRTKEPAMATLSVHETMGFKVDREAVATLVLPQLWAMSMGPLLNVDQFQRFMSVIKKLGERVEREHDQFLRDAQRIEDRSATAVNGTAGAIPAVAVDFESLVGRAGSGSAGGSLSAQNTSSNDSASWDDDVWGSIFNDTVCTSHHFPPRTRSPRPTAPPPMAALTTSPNQSRMSSFQPQPSKLSSSAVVTPIKSTIGSSDLFSTLSQANSPTPPLLPKPFPSPVSQIQPQMSQPSKPNYNISLQPLPTTTANPPTPFQQSMFQPTFQPLQPSTPSVPSISLVPTPSQMPSMGGMLTPSRPAQSSWNAPKKSSQSDWGDFDPLA
ncbi:other/SCY1 protein kinase [Macrolepiota fuliginosa MF-IS2]|uniref:Other/SCY1 protein kinase n=1 Tax=Macrolepiota fuliginosa MF-IS2 TaxID=1400762 RepID=A0A9P6C8E5_9AGAR|nr:other/SCY1 protein kinase [Macrolepiota fuliginosa MF-IS2]